MRQLPTKPQSWQLQQRILTLTLIAQDAEEGAQERRRQHKVRGLTHLSPLEIKFQQGNADTCVSSGAATTPSEPSSISSFEPSIVYRELSSNIKLSILNLGVWAEG